MHKKRNRFVLSIAVMLALLAGLLPMTFSNAMESSQPGNLQCPPMDSARAKDPGFLRSLPAQCRAQASRATSQAVVLATGGPDEFGYTYDDALPVNWISATNDSGVTGDEDTSGPFFDIGFSFPFYGFNYSQLTIHTNGFLTFDPIFDCCFFTPPPIPSPEAPNNYIAALWDDLVVGAPDNSGAIYYERGGVAPDRYLVVEWRDVTTYGGTEPFSFEVILFENGFILVQIQSLPSSYFSAVGIENHLGDEGLAYHHGNTSLSAPKAIQFTYPTGPIPRLLVSPRSTGKFASTIANTNFPVTIFNTGTAGADTYNLSVASTWAAGLYQDGCVTPLADTDADTVIDTGPLPEGASTTICVSFQTPPGSDIGDGNSGVLTVRSSLDPARTRDVVMSMAIPTSFVQVFEDYENAANAFQINGPEGPTTSYVTDDFYFANGLATLRMPDGRYVYAWRKPDGNFADAHSNIEFSLLNADGSFSLPVTQLTNNAGTGQTYDYDPAVAVAPNGNIGFLWYRWIIDNNTGQLNYNVYFAMISETGTLLYGPTNITNNNLWDNHDDLDVPHFFNPAIAANNEDGFVLSWQEYRTNGSTINNSNIWYAVRLDDGTQLLGPTAFTSNGRSYDPSLHPLTDQNVLLTFVSANPLLLPYFAVIQSDGAIIRPATSLDSVQDFFPQSTPDAVVLSNGSIAVAWPTDSGVALSLLDGSSYAIASGPIFAGGPNVPLENIWLSVTQDSADRIIMTWADGDLRQAFYALADGTGTFITDPLPFRASEPGLLISANGQGNAPIISESPGMEVDIDIVPGSSSNVVSPKMSFVPVAILSGNGFDAVSDVDRTSLSFGRTGDEDSLFMCLSKGSDVNNDGRLDLICFFRFSATGIARGDTQAILKGQTVAGAEFEGMDSLRISPEPIK